MESTQLENSTSSQVSRYAIYSRSLHEQGDPINYKIGALEIVYPLLTLSAKYVAVRCKAVASKLP